MTQQDYRHPIAPAPELVVQWFDDACNASVSTSDLAIVIATRAAQWGADQELKACCQWLHCHAVTEFAPGDLRAARRPKPPSLKEQALQALSEAVKMADDVPPEGICSGQADIIRHALEQLPDNH
jgi:hypothetical protein